MIIDAHAHAVGNFSDVDKLVNILDKHGVDKVALCPGLKNNVKVWPIPNIPIAFIKQHPLYNRYFIHPGIRFSYNFIFKEKGDGNEFVYSFVQKYPDRIIQIYWLDPRKPDLFENLESDWKKWNFKGIKLHQVCTPFTNDDPRIRKISEFAGDKRLPVFIHLWSEKEAIKFLEIVKRYPDTTFILLHLMGMEVVSKYANSFKNIYYDISPYSYINESRLRNAIACFGADHIIFGSDTPFDGDSLRKVMERVRNLDISDDEKAQILGGNIARIIDL